jgi:hypothetical protein
MKRKTVLAYLVAASAVVLTITLSLSTARAVQEGSIKSDQERHPVWLIPSLEGSDLFHSYCASCHGTDGRGAGPVAPALNTSVPDLTTIAKRHGGIFPAGHIRAIIAGDELVTAHGSREMPVWGPVFHQIERDRDFGNVRLENVTRYVESIQQK